VHALIDTDILCYEMGSLKFPDTGDPLPWPLIQDRIDQRIEQILIETEATSWQGYLTGKGNFRNVIATIKPYKGTRVPADRPFWYQAVYNYLEKDRGCLVVEGIEADDAISTAATHGRPESIICSKDKDLKQIHGWHYSWTGFGQSGSYPYYIPEEEALRNFYGQLLTGDPTDNIPGLWGVGKKSSLVLALQDMKEEQEMYNWCLKHYADRFGAYARDFLRENGVLLYLLREHTSPFKDPSNEWIERQWNLDKKWRR
jgi:hypothetical protein